jgi:hypothetical protein
MAEQIISPGVFTRENDLSFLPQGVGAIGAAIVGPTAQGPAFVPTVVRSFAEYERKFGSLSSETFVPQTVREYLRNAGSVTVTRVLGGSGYTFSTGNIEPVAVLAGSGVTSTAAPASGSMTIAGTFGQTAGDEVQITVGSTEFRFVASGAPASEDVASANLYFFTTGSNTTTFLDNIAAEIDAAGIGVDANNEGNTALGITSSNSGVSGNLITVETGSGGTISTDTLQLEGGLDTSIGGGVLLGLIYPSKNINASPSLSTSTTPSGHVISSSFGITLNGANVTSTSLSASLNPTNSDYLFNQLGDSPNNSKNGVVSYSGTPGYTYINFKQLQSSILATDNLSGYASGIGSGSVVQLAKMSATNAVFNGSEVGATEGYSYASTPYIQSQIALGRKSLFRFHTISHGTDLNTKYKISIANLREPGDIDGEQQYSTFSIILRQYQDNDKSPLILEQFNNVNLDPDSPNYIARVIGDRYPEYNETLGKVELKGNYPNTSEYIRVQVSDAVEGKATSPKLSPKGFAAIVNPFPTASLDVNSIFPSASYEGTQTAADGNYNTSAYLGWKSNEKSSDNYNFLKPLPSIEESNIAGAFSVENYSGHADSGLWLGSLSASIDSTGATGPTNNQIKFTVPFQGGTDGVSPWSPIFVGNESSLASTYSDGTNLYGFNLSGASTTGTTAYKKALNILSNQDEYDINMLALPGVIKSLHPSVTNHAVDMVEGRGDTFYVMDLTEYDSSVNTAINDANGLDTNYAAVYYPWVKVLDTAQNKPVLVPPSVIVPGAIAASDAIAAEWFAPAGLNRGVLGNVLEAKIRLNQAERDVLYDAKINPIATFPATGVCIWGQKTLQERSTALDRINVRRLLIALKKFIASSSRYLVFEQNTQATRNRFLNIVNPYLESVQQKQGLYAFRVQMDEGNNTPDVIDRNQLVGAIYLQPTKTAEFIVLDFNVLPTGATFDA